MKKIQIALGVVVFGMVAALLFLKSRPKPVTLHADYGPVADFAFTDQSGKTIALNDLKGKVWVADFVFTRCMGPCPVLTARMAQLQKETAGTKDLAFVSFSVDSDYDKPDVLTKYAKTYGADLSNWHFMTGDKQKIFKLIRESFHLAVEQKPPEKPSENDILHSLYFVLVGRDARVRGYYSTGDAEAMKKLQAEITSL